MSSSNKTEKPTPKKLKDAAKKGQSFKSKDFIITCLILTGVQYVISFASFTELMLLYQQIISVNFEYDIHSYANTVLLLGVKLVLPILLLCILCSALPSLLQTGFLLATKAIKFNFGALNPVKGFKKIFSLRTVKEAVKAILYLGTFFIAVLVVWHQKKGILFQQLHGTPYEMAFVWGQLLQTILWTCLGCIVIILILDALAEYFLHIKDLKMDKQEVKREMKEQEGNPEIKGKRRQLHMEILSEQIKSDIKNSKCIIANPKHIAVGIYIHPEIVQVPFISVLETNQRALAVRAYAKEVGVPVVQHISLARRIYKNNTRYSFIRLDELDELLELLFWLYDVEREGYYKML